MPKKKIFSTPWFSLESVENTEQGITADQPYYRIVEDDGIVVVAMTPERRLVLVRQYRPVLEEYTIEFPAGGINPGESALHAARRELHEETGYWADTLVPLNDGMPLLSSRSTLKAFAFFAEGVMKDPHFVPEERTEVLEASFEDFWKMVDAHQFNQLPGLGALLLWLRKSGTIAMP